MKSLKKTSWSKVTANALLPLVISSTSTTRSSFPQWAATESSPQRKARHFPSPSTKAEPLHLGKGQASSPPQRASLFAAGKGKPLSVIRTNMPAYPITIFQCYHRTKHSLDLLMLLVSKETNFNMINTPKDSMNLFRNHSSTSTPSFPWNTLATQLLLPQQSHFDHPT